MSTNEFPEFLEWQNQCRLRLQTELSNYFSPIPCDYLKKSLQEHGQIQGKLLRPLLIIASGILSGANEDDLIAPALAVECIHTYSLIHDDLPAMDNADFRRGKPTCHTIYGEGMAVLTGDALHTLAMEILVNHPASLSDAQRLQMMKIIAHTCGAYGMAAGQAYDICMLNETIPLLLLEEIYYLKTGKLIQCSATLGYLASPQTNPTLLKNLDTFACAFGLAFQIQDDLLDIEGELEVIGKSQGKDAQLQKSTYPMRVGISKAKDRVEALYTQALNAIQSYGDDAKYLKQLAQYFLHRKK